MKLLKNIRIQAFLVFMLALMQYSNTSKHDYAWDDAIVLTENKRVQKGLSDIPELFENISNSETANRYGYRPISLLSFATDVELFGMDPEASHKVSIFLYGLLCILILVFLNRIFPQFIWGNLIVTMLFVVHPLHTEVVANIKSRDEVLAMIFGIGSLLIYHKAMISDSRKKSIGLFFLSGFLMILGFLSKESAITLCGIACLLPWFTLRSNDFRTNLKNCIPALAFVAVLVGIRVFVYSDVFFQSNAIQLFEKGLFLQDGFVGNPLFDANMSERIATAVFLVGYFAFRFVAPYPLLHDYSYNQFSVVSWTDPLVWASLLTLLITIVAMIYGIKRKSPLGFGLAFFLTTASIYLHLVQIAPDIFAERFMFVPSLGLCIALLSLYELKLRPTFVNIGLCLILFPLFGSSYSRNKAWKDNETLLKTDLPKLKNCVRANYNYALFLHRRYYQLPKELQPAASVELLQYYEHTMQLTDRLFNVYLDLGGAYMEFGFPEKAKEVFEETIEKYPDLSAPYVQMGKYHMSFQKWGNAIPYFEKALEKGAMNSDYHYLLAICQFNTEQHEAAIGTLLEGEKLGVSSSAYHSLIARLYVKMNMKQEAIESLQRGLMLYGNDPGLNTELNGLKQIQDPDDSVNLPQPAKGTR